MLIKMIKIISANVIKEDDIIIILFERALHFVLRKERLC